MGKSGGLDFGLLKFGELRSLFHRPEDLVQLLCPIESCGTGAAHQKITLTSVGCKNDIKFIQQLIHPEHDKIFSCSSWNRDRSRI